jgi:hypothetical protein
VIESIFFNPWIWIGTTLCTILVAVLIFAVVRAIRGSDGYLEDWPWITAIISGILALVLVPTHFGFVLPPYDASFYQTYRITGEVTSIEAAFNGEEGTMSQVFVAEVEGVDLFIRSDDQRFRTVDTGDDVNLVCTKQFRYFQQPWYDCSFGG